MGWSRERIQELPAAWARSIRSELVEPAIDAEAFAERAFWLMVGLIAISMAVWLGESFAASAIPPGGDPGNWVATSYAYTDHPYASQLVPFAYPPLLFPVLGGFVAVGGPIGGVRLFVPLLLVALGLSTAWLARHTLTSPLVGFLVVAFLLADPSLLAMFYWGAYPNLLAFVFMNLAIVGLLRAGRGAPSSGAFQFWIFFAATVLTHSLAGLVLAGTFLVFLVLSLTIPTPGRRSVLREARHGILDSPTIASRALVQSPGAWSGILFFLLTVGGFYLGTFVAGLPHPDYFNSDPAAFSLAPVGASLEAIVPHVYFASTTLIYLIGGVVAVLLGGFAVVRDRRPEWITPAALILVAWVLSTAILLLGGIALRIVTDYGRFGFFFLIPAALGLGYLLEQAWLKEPAPRPAPDAVRAAATGGRLPGASARRFSPARPRLSVTAVAAALLFVVLLVDGTGPAIARNQRAFTGDTHDPMFLEAVHAIEGSGYSGGTMTTTGADKWVRALTGANAYAAYGDPAYLFYPSQEVDSALTYDALTSHCLVSNGYVEAAIRGFGPTFSDGIPDYLAYSASGAHPVLRFAPQSFVVTTAGSAGGANVTENLSGTPIVTLPSSSAAPLSVVYAEPNAIVMINATAVPGAPDLEVNITAISTGSSVLRGLSFDLVPPVGSAGLALRTGTPGTFSWKLLAPARAEPTTGFVYPTNALETVTDAGPLGGSAAVVVSVAAGNASGAARLAAQVTLRTPSAAPYLSPLPQVVDAPAVWRELGVRFILLPNASGIAHPLVASSDESAYLSGEYGLPLLYQNPGWTVLQVPANLPEP